MRPYKVYQIEEGTVIDHITHGRALDVIKILGVPMDRMMSIGMNFESAKLGRKDIVKIEKRELTAPESAKIALIAPTATVNIIRGGECVQKIKLSVPERIEGVVRCLNPQCITNHEEMTTRFNLRKQQPLVLCCGYCERETDKIELL